MILVAATASDGALREDFLSTTGDGGWSWNGYMKWAEC